MPQTNHQDPEGGNVPDGNRSRLQSVLNQPLKGESNFGPSSGPFFSIYSKAAEEEDNKMVERWQKDADGILIFTGLFSASVAALLAVTVQDLRPNSQDTSAFYLGNIYEVLADPNVTRASIPSPVAKPPPFSPPRYAVWVNSLWFLSLVMSLSCALWATSLHQWARRYIRLTQPARCRPEKRARIRAFFANGVDKMHVPWAVEGLPTLLHLSLFLFFSGLVIFLFNVDREVLSCVVCWIGLFSMMYGVLTILPLIRHDSPYNSPLSIPAWFLSATIQYITLKVLTPFTGYWGRRRNLRGRHRGWILGGVEKKAEETASEQSSDIDARIFGWTVGALGDDDSLEKFFEAIPGLFKSKLVKNIERRFPWTDLKTFWDVVDGFLGRTLSSNSVTKSVKSRRAIICQDLMSMIPYPSRYHRDIPDHLRSHFDQAPVSIERLQTMKRWFTHQDFNIAECARAGVARNLPRIQERDGHWFALASDVYDLPEPVLQRNFALGGDNALLATLIDVSRRTIQDHKPLEFVVAALTHFDILHTLPELQHNFCALWNELVQEAEKQRHNTRPVDFRSACRSASHTVSLDFLASVVVVPAPVITLRRIRHLYIALHQGTNAAPTTFSVSTREFDRILLHPRSYPLCNIASHHPDSTAHIPNSRRRPIRPSIRRHLAKSEMAPRTPQRDIVGPCAEPDINEILSKASTPAPASIPPVLNKLLASCEAGASLSNPLLPALSVSIPASPTSSGVPPLPNPNLFASAPSAAVIAPTSFVCSDDLTPQIHTTESGETSQVPVAPHIFQHPDPVPAIITPSSGSDPSDDPDALQSTTSSAYLSHPLKGNKRQGTVDLCTVPDFSEIRSMANPTPRSTHTVSPAVVVSDSQLSPILIPESALLQPDYIPHAL